MPSFIRSWAAALDGDVTGKQVLCPGPGHSRKDRSLAVTPSTTAPDGFVVHSFAGDDFQECRDHVRARLGMPVGASRMDAFTPARRAPADVAAAPNVNRAREIWRASVDIKGTLAETYLAQRALIFDEKEDWHRVLRFHPSCPFGTERAPAMIALMRDIVSDEPRCIQRTRLTPDGHKVDRQMLGPAKGAAIKIDPASRVSSALSIGEGLETCMSGRVQGYPPAWAVGSAGAIAAFPVIAGISRLRIFAENDESGTNEHASIECATRWAAAGQDVVFAIRPAIGKDLNDELRAGFMANVENLWPGAAVITDPEIQERASFQKELAAIRAENARIFGYQGRTSNIRT